jgi:hypothetical protein
MTTGNLISSEQTAVIKAAFATIDVRTLVANHLGVSASLVLRIERTSPRI